MGTWLSANLANIIIVVLLVLTVGSAVRRMVRNKKAGKTSCGCGCSTCSGCSGADRGSAENKS